MTFQDYFPIWNKLQTDQQDRIRSNLNFRTVKKGTIHSAGKNATKMKNQRARTARVPKAK